MKRDELDRFLLKVRRVHDREWFEPAAEFTFKTLRTFRHATDDAVVARQKDDDTVRFGKVVAFEDQAFGLNERHLLKFNRKCAFTRV